MCPYIKGFYKASAILIGIYIIINLKLKIIDYKIHIMN